MQYQGKLEEIHHEIECRHNEKVGTIIDDAAPPFSYAMKPIPKPPVLQLAAQEPTALYATPVEPERDINGRTREEFEEHLKYTWEQWGKGEAPIFDRTKYKSWNPRAR